MSGTVNDDAEATGMMVEEVEKAADPEASAVEIEMEERRSLHSSFPRHVGYTSLLFSLGNVALQIFSHLSTSATFLSSIPYERSAPSMGTTPPTENNGTETCANGDRGAFDEWWNLRGSNEFFEYAQTCGPRFLVGEDQPCLFGRQICLQWDGCLSRLLPPPHRMRHDVMPWDLPGHGSGECRLYWVLNREQLRWAV